MEGIKSNHINLGDAKEVLSAFPDKSIDCCVTSPPYFGLRDYGVTGQEGRRYVGIELNPEYIGIAERRIKKVIVE